MTRTISFAVLTCVCLSNAIACGSNTAASPAAPTLTTIQSSSAAATGSSSNSGPSTSIPSPAVSEPREDRELEGLVTAIPPSTAAGQFTLGNTTIVTTTATVISLNGHTGLFSDLVLGARVHVKGSSSGTSGAVTATAVMIQIEAATPPATPPATVPPAPPSVPSAPPTVPPAPPAGQPHDADDDDALPSAEVELRGAIVTVAGACPALRITVAATTVITTAATRFDLACTAVVATRVVEVKGIRAADGTVTATRIKRE